MDLRNKIIISMCIAAKRSSRESTSTKEESTSTKEYGQKIFNV